jgi:glutamate racemase
MQPSIGVFDSGLGGLTVLKELATALPQYNFTYLGDNARSPYGTRSFSTVYQYTWQCVQWLFQQNCPLVILACNTASAKALRTIQQKHINPSGTTQRVLGVIRPTAEVLGGLSATKHVGILGTAGTVNSQSYVLETAHFFPQVQVHQQACPLWVPLIENGEAATPGADYFIKKYVNELLAQHAAIDTVLLGCTHYPLIHSQIRACLPPHIQLVSQGGIVAQSLVQYLARHPEIDATLTKGGEQRFFTTEQSQNFAQQASLFYKSGLLAETVRL